VTDEKIFANPRKVEDVADCYFYHTMELPGCGVIEGRDWDLRGRVDEYVGNVDFAGQRVLEIGTMAMPTICLRRSENSISPSWERCFSIAATRFGSLSNAQKEQRRSLSWINFIRIWKARRFVV
jgi:hypothetical protein